MEVKTYLQQVRRYDTLINNKLSELEHLHSMTVKITATLKDDVVSASGSQDKLGDAVAKIVDLENEINEAVGRYVDIKRSINALLECMNDPDEITVIHMLYYEGKTWREIAEKLICSERNAQYVHGRALLSVAALMQNRIDDDEMAAMGWEC